MPNNILRHIYFIIEQLVIYHNSKLLFTGKHLPNNLQKRHV